MSTHRQLMAAAEKTLHEVDMPVNDETLEWAANVIVDKILEQPDPHDGVAWLEAHECLLFDPRSN